jgi:hypothetical protein
LGEPWLRKETENRREKSMVQKIANRGIIDRHLCADFPMASSSEEAKVLEAAVAGIPKIAEIIAFMPVENRASAFDAAERTYLQIAKDLGGAEELAQKWASAVMVELRGAVDERVLANRRLLSALHEELIGEAIEAGHLDEDD